MFARTKVWLKYQNDQHKACVYETLREYVDFNRKLNKKQMLKTMFKKKYLGWWLLLAIVIALSVALSVYHDRIVLAIRPVAEKIVNTPGAWAVPVAALIVVSVPPLIGHELIILVVGVLWGLWWGFLIAVAGTFIGEILTYYLFKYTLRERAKKFEEKSRLYAGLAHVMRRDGLWMITLVRWSYLPGHLVTCIQSTIGISVWIFGIACAISLPKQLALVYLGVLFGNSHKLDNEGKSESQIRDEAASNRTHKIVSWTVLCLTGFLSVVAMYIIWFRMWQEEKRIAALAPSTASSSVRMEGKEELNELESGIQYTLPYIHRSSSDSMSRDRSTSHASTSTSPPTIHTAAGRPKLGRSRSSTLTSLMASNNSLPYLPYTPMLDVNTSGFQSQHRASPSPVPSAMVAMPSPTYEENDPFLGNGGSSVHSAAEGSNSHLHGGSTATSVASTETNTRPKHLRLARSTSDVVLRPTGAKTLGDTATVSNRRPSRLSSNLGPGRDASGDSSVSKSIAHPLSAETDTETMDMDSIK